MRMRAARHGMAMFAGGAMLVGVGGSGVPRQRGLRRGPMPPAKTKWFPGLVAPCSKPCNTLPTLNSGH